MLFEVKFVVTIQDTKRRITSNLFISLNEEIDVFFKAD